MLTFICPVPMLSYKTSSPRFFSSSRIATYTPARPRIRATYQTDLQTLARNVSQTSTDSLISRVSSILQTNNSLSEQTLQQMVIHLADSRGMARLSLVESFGKVGSSSLPILLTALETCPNPVVRRSCAKALAKIGDSAATDALLHTLVHDEDTVTRSSAAGALAKMGPVAVPKLISLISDASVSMTTKGHATWAISFMQDSAGDVLFDSMSHPNRDVRIAVVSALGAVAIGDALPSMGAVDADDWGDSTNKHIRDRAIVAIRQALKDENAQVRSEAVTALANAGCREDSDAIAAMLSDDDPELRRCAALALMKIPDKKYISILRECEANEEEIDSVRSVIQLVANTLERGAREKHE